MRPNDVDASATRSGWYYRLHGARAPSGEDEEINDVDAAASRSAWYYRLHHAKVQLLRICHLGKIQR